MAHLVSKRGCSCIQNEREFFERFHRLAGNHTQEYLMHEKQRYKCGWHGVSSIGDLEGQPTTSHCPDCILPSIYSVSLRRRRRSLVFPLSEIEVLKQAHWYNNDRRRKSQVLLHTVPVAGVISISVSVAQAAASVLFILAGGWEVDNFYPCVLVFSECSTIQTGQYSTNTFRDVTSGGWSDCARYYKGNIS